MNKPKNTFQILRYFINQYPSDFFLISFLLIVAGIVETIGVGAMLPLLQITFDGHAESEGALHNIVDNVFVLVGVEQNFQNLLLLMVVTISIKAGITYISLKRVAEISVAISAHFRKRFIYSLLNADWAFYKNLGIGSSTNSIVSEADGAGQFCLMMGQAFSFLVQAFIYSSVAFLVDWKVSILAILMGGGLVYVLKFLVSKSRDAGHRVADSLNELTKNMNESLMAVKAIKAMGREKYYTNLLYQETENLESARKAAAKASILLKQAYEPLLVLLMALGLYGAYTYSNYPLSELFMIAFLFNRLLSKVSMVQSFYQKSTVFEGAINAISNKIDRAEQAHEDKRTGQIPTINHEILINNVSLSYDGISVFNNFSAQIPAFGITTIYGPSGSGKSTLIDMILSLLKPASGSIVIDGTSLGDLDMQMWRNKIGYVPQETFLFNDTIFKNISLEDSSVPKEKIIEALKRSQAYSFVSKFKEGLDFIVGERGTKLSGGQRQRLAIARALVRSPDILILDEATSALDSQNEQEIMSILKHLSKTMTIIVITHNPNVLKWSDKVIHLK